MEEIIKIVIEYWSIWAPSLAAVLGTVAGILLAISKTKTAIDELRADPSVKDLQANVAKLAQENQELVRCNKLLLDEITRIKNYADEINKEK